MPSSARLPMTLLVAAIVSTGCAAQQPLKPSDSVPPHATDSATLPPKTPAAATRPVAAATPTAVAAKLPIGEDAVVVVDDSLRVRTAPGTGPDAKVLTSLRAGQEVRIDDGPVDASGYAWYHVHNDEIEGWVAAASTTGEPWLASMAGGWAGLYWIPGNGPATGSSRDDVSVFGWSGGYLGFRHKEANSTIDSISVAGSPDGLHWMAGEDLDLHGAGSYAFITDLAEGPSGLLAAGRDESCGGAPIAGLWTSGDGRAWSRVDVDAAFGGGDVDTISGGSSGYVATGSDAAGVAIWLSTDGRTWRRVPPPVGELIVTSAVAFADGFVLGGAVLLPSTDTCGIALQRPALWWTADGSHWSRANIEGGDGEGSVSVHRITDLALIAFGGRSRVISTDGRNWQEMTGQVTLEGRVLTDGRRGIVLPWESDGEIVGFDPELQPIVLAQAGALPTQPGIFSTAFGPSGLLYANRTGSRVSLGVPVGR